MNLKLVFALLLISLFVSTITSYALPSKSNYGHPLLQSTGENNVTSLTLNKVQNEVQETPSTQYQGDRDKGNKIHESKKKGGSGGGGHGGGGRGGGMGFGGYHGVGFGGGGISNDHYSRRKYKNGATMGPSPIIYAVILPFIVSCLV